MALTRAFLKSMNLTEEQVNAIIEEHTNVTAVLKGQIESYKADSEKLPTLQQELEQLRKNAGDDWQKKYNDEHTAFETYKKDVANRETVAKISAAYRKLLEDNKVGTAHIDSILRVTDFADMKIGEDGKLENSDKLSEKIKSDWSGFIATTSTQGGNVETPPGSGVTMTREAFEKLPLNEQMTYANSHPGEVATLYK